MRFLSLFLFWPKICVCCHFMVLITSPSKILIDLHITVKTKKFLILPRLGYPVTSFDQKIICALAGSRDIFVNVILLTTNEVHA